MDFYIVFPIVLKWIFIVGCFVALGIWYFIGTLTDEECAEMGYKRRK